jgi:RND family efflux transporter MFP subunit
MMKRWYLPIGLLVAAILITVIVRGASSRRGTPVEVAAVRTGPLEAEWSATGYVEARTANITSPQTGQVVEVRVTEGDRVQAGQTLARLSTETEEAALHGQQQGAQASEAQTQAARSTLEETERLIRDRVVRAVAEVNAARARRRQAQAALERSRRVTNAQVTAAKAEADAARAELADLQKGARPEEIAQAQTDVEKAEAEVTWARAERERRAMLYQEGAGSRQSLEEAHAGLVQAEAVLRRAQSALQLLKQGPRTEQVAAARARVRAAEQQIAVADANRDGTAVERRRVEEAAAAVKAAEAALSEARSAARRADTLRHELRAAEARAGQSKAALSQARAVLSERILTAPFAGVVGRRFVDPGDLASPAQSLFTIVEAERNWVSAEVDEQDLLPVRQGQRVEISAPGYAGRVFSAVVQRIGAESVPQTEIRTGARIVRVRIRLDSLPREERRLLKPGMQVHVEGRAALAQQATLIPNDAVQTDSEGSYVFVVEGDTAKKRRVRTGYVASRDTEIVSGLRQGERVVLVGKEGLEDGQRVAVTK